MTVRSSAHEAGTEFHGKMIVIGNSRLLARRNLPNCIFSLSQNGEEPVMSRARVF
jgi:hypothetical protein